VRSAGRAAAPAGRRGPGGGIALNSSATYIAVSASGAIGAAVIGAAGASWLGPVAVVFLLVALLVAAPGLLRRPALTADGRAAENGAT
jgi:predicted MFS family arabinose efflux permease